MYWSKKSILIPVLVILPLLCFVLTLCIGRYAVTLPELWSALAYRFLGVGGGVNREIMAVVTEIRLPRAFIGLMVGASLATSGAAFQGLFRNPLISGSILGVSSGAGFGAALSILLYSSVFMTPLYAFAFGILAVILSYFCGRIDNTSPVITMILGGTIVQSVFSALLSLMKYIADPSTELPAITFWLMGSLASTKTSDLLLSCLPMAIGIIGLFFLRYRLNVLSMGDRESHALGINTTATKVVIIIFATLATAGAVCVSGVIGWVGLIIPHIARIFVGSDNRFVIPTSISLGACFVIICDTICRTLTAGEIPLGIVTFLIGGPFFIYLLKKTKGKNW